MRARKRSSSGLGVSCGRKSWGGGRVPISDVSGSEEFEEVSDGAGARFRARFVVDIATN